MKLDEVSKIVQTTSWEDVNNYLAKGYKIIKIFSIKKRAELTDEVMPCYILGLGKLDG